MTVSTVSTGLVGATEITLVDTHLPLPVLSRTRFFRVQIFLVTHLRE